MKETSPGGDENVADNNTLSSNTGSSKPKESKRKAPASAAAVPDFSGTTFSTEMVEKVETWLRYKEERREGYKPTGLQSLITEIQNNVDRYGERAVLDLIGKCMASNWAGIIFERLKGLPEVRKPDQPQTMPETNNEFARLRQRMGGAPS